MTGTVLSRRALNRATLARQHLLERSGMGPVELVEHLVGLQAQTPHTWYVGLWNRLADCSAEAVGALLAGRSLVRLALMRSTIHLVSARDALALRPLTQPPIERSTRGAFGRHLAGIDEPRLVAAGRAAVERRPMTFSELGRVLAAEFPGRDQAALAQAVRAWVPLVQVPPRGVWGRSGRAAHTSLESWLGAPVRADYPVDELFRRYLGAFGPASVRDAQTWSGLTRLAEVAERLRRRLVTFTDEHGVELFDLPEAPRPDPETPAPARLLYDFDNLLLSHADRRRVVTAAYRAAAPAFPDNVMPRLVLVDGFTAGHWTVTAGRGTATLTVRPFGRLSGPDTSAVAAEGRRLLAFLHPTAAGEVTVAPAA